MRNGMTTVEFIERLRTAIASFANGMQADDGTWSVKGFIDTRKEIYTISTDTKVLSKIVELYLFPRICQFAKENNLQLQLSREQNSYPDMTFIDKSGNLFAVDIKSSYRKTQTAINGMTLGSFTGYFRNRSANKNIAHPYDKYKAHVILGVIYSVTSGVADERKVYRHDELRSIKSVIKDFEFFVQEKWKIAIDRPGSGNTKNIGSVCEIRKLVNGLGPFARLGEKVFDDYWMHYLTNDMARAAELSQPYYSNLAEYKRFRGMD